MSLVYSGGVGTFNLKMGDMKDCSLYGFSWASNVDWMGSSTTVTGVEDSIVRASVSVTQGGTAGELIQPFGTTIPSPSAPPSTPPSPPPTTALGDIWYSLSEGPYSYYGEISTKIECTDATGAHTWSGTQFMYSPGDNRYMSAGADAGAWMWKDDTMRSYIDGFLGR